MKKTHAPVLARWLFLVAGGALLGCSGGGGTPDASTAGAAGTGTAGAAGTGTAGAAGTGTTGGSGGAVGGSSGGNAGTGVGGGGASGATGGTVGTGAAGGGSGSGGVGGRGGSTGATGGTGGAAGRGGASGGTGGGGGTTGTGGNATRYTCPSGSFTTPNPSTITLTKVSGVPPFDAFNNNGNNFGNIEGTVWFGDALYVSEIGGGNNPPPARILRVPTTGAVSIAHPTSGTNGLAIDLMGRLIGASHTAGAVLAFNLAALPSPTSTPIVSEYMGSRLNTPNDLTVRSDGTIYFTDPDFQAPNPRPQQMTRVYRLPAGSTTPTVVDAGRSNPNGITLSLDEAFLFVTDGQGLWRYAVNADGSTGTATRIAQSAVSSGDGMGIDCAGSLYVTSQNRVVVVNPTGTGSMLGTISVNAQSATNVAFGGANHQTLYVSGLGNGMGGGATMGLFRADMPLPGMPF